MFPLPANTFPPIELSEKDTQTLEALADFFVQETIQKYQEHRLVNKGIVDTNTWKKVKQREDVRVYRERYPTHDASEGASAGALHMMPKLITVGTIRGNLDDVMYGVVNVSSDAMKLKSAYVGDGFVDWGNLACLIKPTPQNPFRELSIKWTVKGHSLLIGTVLRARDNIYIESTGITETKDGERIGYHLQHSVDLPDARELHEYNVVRMKISFCHLYRQRKEGVVDVFIHGVMCPMGDAPASLSALTAAEVSVSVWKNMHCATMKKLAWLVRNNKPTATPAQRGSTCGVCTKNLSSGFSMTSQKDRTCRLCLEPACSRCRETHTICFTSAFSDSVIQRKMQFCTSCLKRASRASPIEIAVSEMSEGERELSQISSMSITSSTMSVSVSTTSAKEKTARGRNYDPVEDVELSCAWVRISQGPMIGIGQSVERFWTQVEEIFEATYCVKFAVANGDTESHSWSGL